MAPISYRAQQPDEDGTRWRRSDDADHWSEAGIHWAAVFIAAEHKRENGLEWVCQCSCCSQVRPLYEAQKCVGGVR